MKVEKDKKMKTKSGRRKEIIKRSQWNKKQSTEKITKPKSALRKD